MLIPLSWLKEFVEIKLPVSELAVLLSNAGLAIEKWTKDGEDYILDFEITPNRPDWMSVFGMAREISALTGAKLKEPVLKIETKKIKNPLPIDIKPNYDLVPRITSVIIRGVTVKPSPLWLSKRIKQIGLRPINNLVDITNYVLWTYGGLLHVFDYDKIRGHQMTIDQAKGGEPFRSLDGIDYILPKGAIIIKDVGRVIDLLPLKGGENTASYNETKNVLLHSVVVDPVLTRKTSQALNLRSDSSAIAERGLDPNVTIKAVNHALSLILELAGGEVASEIMDHKEKEFKPWTISVTHEKIENVLGIKIESKKIIDIFNSLGLNVIARSVATRQSTKKIASHSLAMTDYEVTIPTFRNDIHIEEDLIEEVGRVIGYDTFPKTLPQSAVPTAKVAYARDYDLEYETKQILNGVGYNEIGTYSMVSEKQLVALGIDPARSLRLINPISKDYEFMRPNLLGNLLDAVKQNQAVFPEMKIYELGKIYLGETIDKFTEEYWLCATMTGEKTMEAKGCVELLLNKLGVKYSIRPATSLDNHYWFHPGRTGHIENSKGNYLGVVGEIHPNLATKWGIKGKLAVWTVNYDLVSSLSNREIIYQSVSKYPGVYEDLTLIAPTNVLYGDIVKTIKASTKLIYTVDLLGTHEGNLTVRLTYLDPSKNLDDAIVSKLRTKIIADLKEELKVKLQE